MKRHLFLAVVLFPIVFFVAGCASKNVGSSDSDFRSFEQRATYQIDIPKNSVMTVATLLSVPQTVLADIQLDESVESVLYVKLYEKNHLNISKHLIREREFYYDKNQKKLKILFDLPVIYMLSTRVDFKVEALAVIRARNKNVAGKIEKFVSFYWKPQTWITEAGTQYRMIKYVDPVNDRYEEKQQLVRTAREEIAITNVMRMAPYHKSLVRTFTQKK